MRVDKALVERIAANARLTLSSTEVKNLIPQLQDILDVFSTLSEVETSDVDLALHPLPIINKVREDKEGTCLTQEEALSTTVHKKDGFFKGPKVLS